MHDQICGLPYVTLLSMLCCAVTKWEGATLWKSVPHADFEHEERPFVSIIFITVVS